MPTDPSQEHSDSQTTPEHPQPRASQTLISSAWVMAVSFIIGLVILLIFILQNLRDVSIQFFGLHWEVPLGIAMLLAAVVGGFLMALVGTARVVQLERSNRRSKS